LGFGKRKTGNGRSKGKSRSLRDDNKKSKGSSLRDDNKKSKGNGDGKCDGDGNGNNGRS
jgi:hypothetical protein